MLGTKISSLIALSLLESMGKLAVPEFNPKFVLLRISIIIQNMYSI